MSTRKQLLGLVFWLVITFVAAAIGSIASSGSSEFYAQLDRPEWAPPSSVFGPVWTVLYVIMAVAAWLVWRADGFRGARAALVLYLVQLVVNGIWTWTFFAWRDAGLALADILVLLVLIVATIVLFWRVSRTAGLLLVPYLLWVGYATALTYAIWQRNPQMV